MSTRRVVVVALTLALVAGVVVLVSNTRHGSHPGEDASASEKGVYQCAMHPQIVSDRPGVCPICQMNLQRVDSPAHDDRPRAATSPAEEKTARFYRHPMRADVTSPTPAKDEMGMDYIPVYEDDVAAGESEVPGHAPFELSTERQQLIGVTRAKVEVRALDLEIRTVGRVAYDPDLYQAIVEYREALRARAQVEDSRWPDARRGADALVRAASLKLRQRGISPEQLRSLHRDGEDPVNLLLPGKDVWVYAQVYEYEVGLVRPGQIVEITAPAEPGRTYRATVAAIDPILDATTRSLRVRALVSTPDGRLQPEMFVRVKILVPIGNVLAVPEDAVLDTGERQVVFVVSGKGAFEPRSLRLGREAAGYYEVLSGLAPGEEIVTSANFLIDSESRFRAALAAFAKTPPPAPAP